MSDDLTMAELVERAQRALSPRPVGAVRRYVAEARAFPWPANLLPDVVRDLSDRALISDVRVAQVLWRGDPLPLDPAALSRLLLLAERGLAARDCDACAPVPRRGVL